VSDKGEVQVFQAHAGVFTAPRLASQLAAIFEEAGHLDKLGKFCSEYGAQFLRLPPPRRQRRLVLSREATTVPVVVNNVVVFNGGTTLPWSAAWE